jgi:ATP-dependent DNA ligase
LKTKAVQRGKFPVVSFVKDPTGVAALYLGQREGKDLRYIGKVGTWWARTKSAEIRKALDTVISPKQKLTKPVRKPKATVGGDHRAPQAADRVEFLVVSKDCTWANALAHQDPKDPARLPTSKKE